MANILIVDDIPETRSLMERILKFEPEFDVVGTAGADAFAAVGETSADVVLMDLATNGIEITKLVKDAYPWVQVIIVSTLEGTPEEYRGAMRAGASDFVTKDNFLRQL